MVWLRRRPMRVPGGVSGKFAVGGHEAARVFPHTDTLSGLSDDAEVVGMTSERRP